MSYDEKPLIQQNGYPTNEEISYGTYSMYFGSFIANVEKDHWRNGRSLKDSFICSW